MGVRVVGQDDVLTFEGAHEWFVTVEGELQIYQHTATEEDCTIVEYARGTWHRVFYYPMPELPKDDGQTYEKEEM